MAEKTLWQQLAERIGGGDSKTIPGVFESLTTEDEARLLLAASPPATAEEISEKTGLAPGDIEKMVDSLFRKGLLFKSKKADATRYYCVRNVLQLHDATAVMLDPPKRMLDLWYDHFHNEWDSYIRKVEKGFPRQVIRVIPVNVSIDLNTQVLAFEDMKKLVEASRILAVTRCSCRVIDGACGKPVDVCIQVDKAADYAIERGTGRELTKQETIDMLKMCEEEGLVHIAGNGRGLGHVICNCCSDCCINWASVRTGEGRFVAPSRYRALVEAEDCNGCEVCLDRCYFEALTMDEEEDIAAIDGAKCMGCGLCQVVCPTDAIMLDAVRPEEFVPA
jgi:Pyruvate/2-oxoacid:ferredoxin oxidoreductase delta subunit/predicted transcriptional regulator